ncbi:hypothetical protein BDQ17DRAFT_1333437 [Cyathus striatus]|nr:hypothetical protein BDQ17DRAFT_1333437 [Cyathus striatus]
MPPCRSARKHTTISSTDPTTQPAKKKGRKGVMWMKDKGGMILRGMIPRGMTLRGMILRRRKGKREKDDSQAAPPVKLTNAEQNIIDDGISVAPPKRIRDALSA